MLTQGGGTSKQGLETFREPENSLAHPGANLDSFSVLCLKGIVMLIIMMPSYSYFQFAASPRCQSILNDIIYKDPCWQDRNLPVKLIWAVFIQLPLVAVFSLIYVPCHLAHLCVKRVGCSSWLNLGGRCTWCCCRLVRNTFEHPYSKFVNHTTGYLAFLCVIGANTFETNFETSLAGLSTLGKYIRIKLSCNWYHSMSF